MAESNSKSPMDYLIIKQRECPVCGLEFTDFAVRKSKLRVITTDTDMRTTYHDIDSNLYDVSMCDKCGYASQSSLFDRINDRQASAVMEKVMPSFRLKPHTAPLSPEQSAERYKQALVCAEAKNAKDSEKGILNLKLAWVYRSTEDSANEAAYLKAAYEALKTAYAEEPFPLGGALDEQTAQLLVGDLARRLGDNSEALKWVGRVMTNRNISDALKTRAEDIRELLREAGT